MDDFSTEIIPDPTLSGEVSPGGARNLSGGVGSQKAKAVEISGAAGAQSARPTKCLLTKVAGR
ncbi:hypothetical protein [Methylotetracoccus oryzae]|uniref:hypothetical protein n=1 Tax=Methylotetracoccus oryzae TaxID=1919059 RepID=UPI001117F946|nr:hypothetical protein [Methylotetracoccus oryzae]